jgi:hypothetical protein
MRESLDNGLANSVFRTRLNSNFEELYGQIIEKSASFTIATGDVAKILNCTLSTPLIVTIPTNASVAIPVGLSIEFIQAGTGPLVFIAAAGVTLTSLESRVTTSGQHAVAKLTKKATDTWVLSGEIA